MISSDADQIHLLRARWITPLKVGNASVSGGVAKAILRAVHDHGIECDEPLEQIAREVCVDLRTARRAIKALRQAHLLTVLERPGRGNTAVIDWTRIHEIVVSDKVVTSCWTADSVIDSRRERGRGSSAAMPARRPR